MPVNFTLFDISAGLIDQWREAFTVLVPAECRARVVIVHGGISDLHPPFDLHRIACQLLREVRWRVSWTSRYFLLPPSQYWHHISFDQVLSDRLSPPTVPDALTRVAQRVIYDRWRGYAPPGTCTLLPLSGTPCAGNPFSCRYVALCPTMRLPSSVVWHKEIVYNCVWSLLVEIDHHNARAAVDPRLHPIRSVVMTGIGTGIGRIPPKQCAKQTALAFAHYHAAKTRVATWSTMTWADIEQYPLNVRLPSDAY
ncbi:macro domain-like protein [Pisolithus orientalis]|uniref:macro domain-like protein n=1 Tax=Pisolithus orientalis TaxID=936130 RepID=UPI002224CBBA|nr:macro domain-like protein [Pisolithus orientalis]KAI6000986.1 macro domain-like protein [Pisolithus orientalis]